MYKSHISTVNLLEIDYHAIEDEETNGHNITLLNTLRGKLTRMKNFILRNPHPELGSYIQIMNVLYYGGSLLFNIPVYLAYDPSLKLYRVKKCNEVQRMICLVIQIIVAFSAFHRVSIPARAVWANKTYIVPYFDFVNECILNIFIYLHYYMHWFSLDRIEKYVELLQTTNLLKYDRTATWKGKIFPATFWVLVVFLSFSWSRAVHGVDWTSWEGFLASGENNARDMFWLAKDDPVSVMQAIIANASRFFNCMGHHSILNNYTPVSMLPIFFLGKDFYWTILNRKIEIPEVLEHYEEYKGLIDKANVYANTYLFYYVSMTVTFNSVHLFDTLNTSDLMWKTNMYVYDFDTWFIMWVPTKILINGKKMKKWLWKDENYLKLPKQSLALLLHDLIPWIPRKGMRAGRYLVISSEFTASVLATMWSYSLMVMLNGK